MKKMNMVEPSYLDGFLDGVPGDKDFPEDGPLDLLDFLDFPMESLEDETGGDWDASKSHCLGPIPTDALLSLPPVSQDHIGNAFPTMLLESNAPVGGTGEAQESGSFQIHSPVSVLDSSGSCSVGKSLTIKSDVVIPVRTRSKRARPSNLNPWFVMPPISSARKMIRSRKNKEKKKKVSPMSLVKITDDSFQRTNEELLNASDATEKKEGSQQRSVAVKKCTHCEVTKTPQWREGPMGPKTLCNACGVRYRSGRLFPEYRPAASPTFVPALHSNSHKKVIEMRKKATVQETATLHDVPVSPPPEFVPMSGSLFDFIY